MNTKSGSVRRKPSGRKNTERRSGQTGKEVTGRIIERQVDRVLTAMEEVPLREAMDDAESYICAHCLRPVKICQIDVHTVCAVKMKEGTMLYTLRQRNRGGTVCISCGRALSAAALRRNPLAEICPSCRRNLSLNIQLRGKEQRHDKKARGA